MGAGAAIQQAQAENAAKGPSGPGHQNNAYLNNRSKYDDNSVNMSYRSGRATNRSVRAMALMNHARQENSYIPVGSLRLASTRTKNNINPIDHTSRTIQEETVEPSTKYERKEQEEKQTGAPSLNAFKMNLNLKLQLEDDQEWTHVSEDEEENENNLNLFDKRLIELPLEDAEKAANAASSGDNSNGSGPKKPMGLALNVNAGMQIKKEGELVVDGMNFAVGNDGIIRHDRPSNYYNKDSKLPMRERLIILCKLGAGASSAVYKALDLKDMRLVALKTIQVYDKDKRVQMIRELSALYQLLRENSRRESSYYMPKLNKRPEKYIVDFYDAFSNLEDGVVCLMIEYMDGGSLQDIVDQGGCDDEPTLANIAIQALKGLQFLHNCSQLHRDLKPANFLISHRGEVKVADLGIMKQMGGGGLLINKMQSGGGGGAGSLVKTNTFVGTATYMSPERIDGKDYSYPADVWAFGLSLLALAIGRLPIDTQGGYWTILHNIRDAPPPSLPEDDQRFGSDLRDFIGSCLKRVPEDRASIKQLLKHPFLNKAIADDLTYNQSYERGRNELLSILKAMVAHLQHTMADLRERFSNEDEYLSSASAMHLKTFGNLYAYSDVSADSSGYGNSNIKAVLRRLLLDDKDSIMGAGNSNTESNHNRRLRKPRLSALARQIHLPVDKVIMEVKDFIASLDDE